MEAITSNKGLFENKEFIMTLDSLIQEKLNQYNLELLIQCERQGVTNKSTSEKVKELIKIRKDIKEFKNISDPENSISIISAHYNKTASL
tara:strand:- start:22912 stop:23181 length:270 start_codon:yes stop_codon:yes gene_type:complete